MVVRAGREGTNFPSARFCDTAVIVSGQETPIPKKRGPKPTGWGKPIMLRLQRDDLKLLDRWIATNAPDASRPEAMRRILRLVAVRVERAVKVNPKPDKPE